MRFSGGCREVVHKVWGGCLEGMGRLSGGSEEVVWKVWCWYLKGREGFLEDVRRLSV